MSDVVISREQQDGLDPLLEQAMTSDREASFEVADLVMAAYRLGREHETARVRPRGICGACGRSWPLRGDGADPG